MPHADEAAARALATDLLGNISGSTPLTSARGKRAVTASSGVALFCESDGADSSEALLAEADIALYEAKDAGRGQVRVYGSGDVQKQPLRARFRWTDRIRSALDEERLLLYAQPIRPLRKDPLQRWEVLLRMKSDEDELLAPSSFLPTAERSTLIQEIDRWVVHHAVCELAAHQHAGHPMCFAVNLSAKSMTDPGMPSFVVGELETADADGRGLVFEVTETAAVINVARARSFARTMADRGCALALDDFGAGFTSFHYLKHLNFDFVKIDGEFIRELSSNRANQSLVRALAEMARSLGKRTIAEYVGDDATIQWLRTHGIDYAQGFHIGRPRPLEQLNAQRAGPT
jgi:EAL domain-containing protein (putative c-di-GMP-specific phosphodiesterase class I)